MNKKVVNQFLGAIILCAIIIILGALFKIMHWPGGNFLFIIGLISEMIVAAVLIIYVLKNKKNGNTF